jgi:tetraacyldisaccharide 4'-kinase
MKLVAPSFWQKRGLIAQLLRPLRWLYSTIVTIRRFSKHSHKISVPVICVGNLTMGGSGKTPIAIALRDWFSINTENTQIAFLTRGYKGKQKAPLLVDLDIHTAKDVGDEALILAEYEPTWVAQNRFAGAQKAVENGAQLLIMDDGLQHLTLQQDIRFVVVDGSYGFGNELVFPAGPLRESLHAGLERADALIIVGEDRYQIKERFTKTLPIFQAYFTPLIWEDEDPLYSWKDQKIIAFAGIGHPQKFYDFLMKQDCNVIDFKAFPDHHTFKRKELDKLWQSAEEQRALLVTTQKDFVRLPHEFQDKVKVCHIWAEFAEPRALDHFLREKMAHVQ